MNKEKNTQPAVNIYDLGEGNIVKNYSDDYQQYLLENKLIDNFISQTLPEIVDIIDSVEHRKIARLAYHHMATNRKDSNADKEQLYQYINDNFYIVSCFRNNVFECALSNGIKDIAHYGNIDSHVVKLRTYTELHKNKITIPIDRFIEYLDRHRDSIGWVAKNFNVSSKFVYEDHAQNLTDFIENMTCFEQPVQSWESMFGLSWEQWNKCHRLFSDVLTQTNTEFLTHTETDTNDTLLTPHMVQSLAQLPALEQQFLTKKALPYLKSKKIMDQLINAKLTKGGIPIKLQTLVEKKMIVNNFNECLQAYNKWALINNFKVIEDSESIINEAYEEMKYWYESIPSDVNSAITKLLN